MRLCIWQRLSISVQLKFPITFAPYPGQHAPEQTSGKNCPTCCCFAVCSSCSRCKEANTALSAAHKRCLRSRKQAVFQCLDSWHQGEWSPSLSGDKLIPSLVRGNNRVDSNLFLEGVSLQILPGEQERQLADANVQRLKFLKLPADFRCICKPNGAQWLISGQLRLCLHGGDAHAVMRTAPVRPPVCC